MSDHAELIRRLLDFADLDTLPVGLASLLDEAASRLQAIEPAKSMARCRCGHEVGSHRDNGECAVCNGAPCLPPVSPPASGGQP